ncbi:LacI family transcriptional regulator [Pigmentiphaga sp. NML030171]|uniref:Bug family tripartite tricarboxylate transporter substrate binding protein n=1 Tax=Pigmentiphaga sp. NML030171 TaxID=2008676 RepID=UPI000B4230FF|nr:tripartite tricarboxylate transporter substrate binding protein [Pigmentiphaga sp. NML030171]OVZ66417.1 LacI family transcriptional regulator [Pigmentiphaga sp. NML030171]
MHRYLAKFSLALSLGCAAVAAWAGAYPDRPLKMIVPFAAGASSDMLARTVADGLATRLGQPVVVENRAGAGGNIGADLVAKAAPDGYSLVIGSIGTHATNSLIYGSMPYDTVKDFTPVTLVASVSLVLVVHPSVPARDVKQLIAYLQERPGKVSYASGGVGASQHLAGELFKYLAKVDMVHVPYKGSAGSIPDLISGRVPVMFADLPLVLSYIQNGSLRALAVGDRERSPVLPSVPTLAESGVPDYQANAWYGLFAPAGTPPDIANRLQREVAAILEQPEVRKRLIAQGANPSGMAPDAFKAFQRKEIDRWKTVVQAAHIKMD